MKHSKKRQKQYSYLAKTFKKENKYDEGGQVTGRFDQFVRDDTDNKGGILEQLMGMLGGGGNGIAGAMPQMNGLNLPGMGGGGMQLPGGIGGGGLGNFKLPFEQGGNIPKYGLGEEVDCVYGGCFPPTSPGGTPGDNPPDVSGQDGGMGGIMDILGPILGGLGQGGGQSGGMGLPGMGGGQGGSMGSGMMDKVPGPHSMIGQLPQLMQGLGGRNNKANELARQKDLTQHYIEKGVKNNQQMGVRSGPQSNQVVRQDINPMFKSVGNNEQKERRGNGMMGMLSQIPQMLSGGMGGMMGGDKGGKGGGMQIPGMDMISELLGGIMEDGGPVTDFQNTNHLEALQMRDRQIAPNAPAGGMQQGPDGGLIIPENFEGYAKLQGPSHDNGGMAVVTPAEGQGQQEIEAEGGEGIEVEGGETFIYPKGKHTKQKERREKEAAKLEEKMLDPDVKRDLFAMNTIRKRLGDLETEENAHKNQIVEEKKAKEQQEQVDQIQMDEMLQQGKPITKNGFKRGGKVVPLSQGHKNSIMNYADGASVITDPSEEFISYAEAIGKDPNALWASMSEEQQMTWSTGQAVHGRDIGSRTSFTPIDPRSTSSVDTPAIEKMPYAPLPSFIPGTLKDAAALEGSKIRDMVPMTPKGMSGVPSKSIPKSAPGPKTLPPELTISEPPTRSRQEDILDMFKDIGGQMGKGQSKQPPGDQFGMDILQKLGPELAAITEANRAATPAELNHFRNFGKRAEGTVDQGLDTIEAKKQQALSAIGSDLKAQILGNQSASAGTRNAQLQNAYTQKQKADLKTQLGYDQMSIAQKNKLAQFQNQSEARQMQGEDTKAVRTLQNLDNYYTALGQNAVTTGKLGLDQAKAMNQAFTNTQLSNAANSATGFEETNGTFTKKGEQGDMVSTLMNLFKNKDEVEKSRYGGPIRGYRRGASVENLKKKGRFGDTELVHVNQAEKNMLKSMGGSGTTNPDTGLQEYFWPLLAKAAPIVLGALSGGEGGGLLGGLLGGGDKKEEDGGGGGIGGMLSGLLGGLMEDGGEVGGQEPESLATLLAKRRQMPQGFNQPIGQQNDIQMILRNMQQNPNPQVQEYFLGGMIQKLLGQ